MTSAPTRANKARHAAFRDRVLLYLRDEGFPQADRRPECKNLSASLRAKQDTGDIVGLPWVLGVRCQKTLDLSGALNEARSEAEWAGVLDFASIQQRKGYSLDHAYVTMPLHVFVRVLRVWVSGAVSR